MIQAGHFTGKLIDYLFEEFDVIRQVVDIEFHKAIIVISIYDY